MGRAIVTAAPAPTGSATRGVPDGDAAPISAPADPYGDRLLKLIPAEVISLYLTLTGLLVPGNRAQAAVDGTATTMSSWVPWAFLAGGAAATWLYLDVVMKVKNTTQLGVSVLAFCVWAFAIGGPFREMDWYSGAVAGAAIGVFTFIAPMIPIGDQK